MLPPRSAAPKLARGATAPSSHLARYSAAPHDDGGIDNTNTVPSAQQPSWRTSSGRLYGEMVESQEVEALCSRLGMARRDVWRLRKQFNDEDADSTNSITQTAFFFLIHEERRNFTKTIFRLASIPSDQQRLSFDEYLRCICAFASLTEGELLRFFYDVYTDESASGGAMGESEILKLGKELQAMQSAFSKNVSIATRKMASSRDVLTQQTLVMFDDFQRLSRLNRVAFYPLYQMQRNVRIGSLGEEYWIEKTREKVEVDRMLKYMVRNNGREVELDWKTKVVDFIFRRESSDARVRRRARELYDAQYRHLHTK